MRVLLISAEHKLIKMVESTLEEDFAVDVVDSGTHGLYSAQEPFYSLVLIDDDLPDISGEDLCALIRQSSSPVPIMVIADDPNTSTRISCLDRGADGVMPKKFISAELLARAKALLRRFNYSPTPEDVYKIGKLHIDFWSRKVTSSKKTVHLNRKEFDLLSFFIRNKGRVLSRDIILEALWKDTGARDSNVVDSYVCSLRRRIAPYVVESPIKTVYGLGYLFDDSHLHT